MDNKPNSGSGLGVAGLVLGIIAVMIAFIPCLSMLGLVLGILGVSLSTVGLTQAKKANIQNNLIMAALIVSIIGTSLAALRLTNSIFKVSKIPFERITHELENNIDKKSEKFEKAFEEEFEKEFGGDMEDVLKQLENELEEAEQELKDSADELEKSFNKLSDEEKARKLGKAAGKALKGFVDELADSSGHIEIDIDTD
ncbi:MAG: hypothetical protein JXA77_00115 [Bacteroidales bacterium]|nr:hypothetical protein [Bacteroidales bacterium]MBN2821256.1 hypothetical protein [Bacteroidales bacterium]